MVLLFPDKFAITFAPEVTIFASPLIVPFVLSARLIAALLRLAISPVPLIVALRSPFVLVSSDSRYCAVPVVVKPSMLSATFAFVAIVCVSATSAPIHPS